MSGFNTKEKNNNGEYEITFYTDNHEDFKKVQDLCRELIDHNKPVSTEGDLISRSALKDRAKTMLKIIGEDNLSDYEQGKKYAFETAIDFIDNAPTVELNDKSLEIAQKSIELGRNVGKLEGKLERQKGEWIDYDNTFYKCPECGYLLLKDCPYCQNKIVLPKGGAE